MVGERIRQVRLAEGLSMDALVAKMDNFVTKQAISKYENAKSTPSPEILVRIAGALGVKASYFLKETKVKLEFLRYRKHSGPSQKDLKKIEGRIVDHVEDRLWLESLFSPRPPRFSLPKRRIVKSMDEVEDLAKKVREMWQLGLNPIDNIAETLEDRAMIVIALDADVRVDGVSAWANGVVPVVVTNKNVPGDRQRYNWTHELGHLVAKPAKGLDEEKIAHRFAASFLAPKETVYSELGEKRKRLEISELGLLKQKYGLSMQAWLRRAVDLGIISNSYYRSRCIVFGKKGWRKKEPGPQYPEETPNRLRRLVYRALAEGIISASRAEEICPEILSRLNDVQEPPPTTNANRAIKLAMLSIDERRKKLSLAAAKAARHYATNPELTAFTALDGVEDAQ